MIVIKDMKMPKSCCEFHKDTRMLLHCPFYNCCDKRTTIKVNFKPIDCPLVEIVTCKDCTYDGCAKAHSPNHFCADGERKK